MSIIFTKNSLSHTTCLFITPHTPLIPGFELNLPTHPEIVPLKTLDTRKENDCFLKVSSIGNWVNFKTSHYIL